MSTFIEMNSPAVPLDSPETPTDQDAADSYIELLRARDPKGNSLLVLVETNHPILYKLREAAFRVNHYSECGALQNANLPANHYDAAIIVYQLEKSAVFIDILKKIHDHLKADGILVLVTPTLDSWSARFFGSQWTEWRPENLVYFSNYTLQATLIKSGFAAIQLQPDRRVYSLQHLYNRARAFPRTTLTRAVQTAYAWLPSAIRKRRIRLPASGLVAVAQRVDKRPRPLLSIVMPVYNEQATFEQTLQTVLAKTVPGVDKEIIIVESNSTDGSREIALRYQEYPGVNLIFEEHPGGKGRAVRLGLQAATGDYILIQDADSEYDVNDYDVLVNALRYFRSAFVLGSRHWGDWKIRQYTDQPGIAAYFNLGHTIFTMLFNRLYGQNLKDPFTMYKVFWKDCLYGLEFEANRFDFDHELLAKVIRKGTTILEIPVNYKGRSPRDGKKVTVFRDPLTWIYADFKYRFLPLNSKDHNKKA